MSSNLSNTNPAMDVDQMVPSDEQLNESMQFAQAAQIQSMH